MPPHIAVKNKMYANVVGYKSKYACYNGIVISVNAWEYPIRWPFQKNIKYGYKINY